MNKKGQVGGRIALVGLGIALLLPVIGWPSAFFSGVLGISWGPPISNMIWYVVGKVTCLGASGLCIYAGLTAE